MWCALTSLFASLAYVKRQYLLERIVQDEVSVACLSSRHPTHLSSRVRGGFPLISGSFCRCHPCILGGLCCFLDSCFCGASACHATNRCRGIWPFRVSHSPSWGWAFPSLSPWSLMASFRIFRFSLDGQSRRWLKGSPDYKRFLAIEPEEQYTADNIVLVVALCTCSGAIARGGALAHRSTTPTFACVSDFGI